MVCWRCFFLLFSTLILICWCCYLGNKLISRYNYPSTEPEFPSNVYNIEQTAEQQSIETPQESWEVNEGALEDNDRVPERRDIIGESDIMLKIIESRLEEQNFKTSNQNFENVIELSPSSSSSSSSFSSFSITSTREGDKVVFHHHLGINP